MVWTEVLWGLIAIGLALDAGRIGRRLRSIPLLSPGEASEDSSSVGWVCAPGVKLAPSTRRSALAHMSANRLDALEVIPAHVSLDLAWSLGCSIDPEIHRSDGVRRGDTGAHAFAAPVAVLNDLCVDGAPEDLASFVAIAREVRRRVKVHDFVIAPGLEAHKTNPFLKASVMEVMHPGSQRLLAFSTLLFCSLVVSGPMVAPWMGSAVLAFYLLQQALAVRGSGLRVRRLWAMGLLRLPIDVTHSFGLLRPNHFKRERIDALRPVYAELMRGGTEAFFEARSPTCPLCGEGELTDGFTLPDLYQGKPGRFTVVRCLGCDTRFQNPRLTQDGLAFYYRDFYDGLGEAGADSGFGAVMEIYAARAAMVSAHADPSRWLDVGCGHGHLAAHLRVVFPEARLEGLDIGDGVDVGMARGWIDEAHRGFFPDLAQDLVARFDVVSMCHYLEHTLDIRAELDAAALVLKEGGLLFIEVPDPQSIFARLMGRWWMPWFQPQHLQIVTTDTMSALLEEAGFEPLQWHTGEAAASNDLLLAISNMVRRWAPPLDVPWRPEPSAARLLTHGLVWSFGGGLILAGAILDKILAPIVRRSSHASQFRVIARKVSAPLAEGLLTTA